MTRQEEIVLARIIDLRETLDKFEAGSLKELQRAYSSAQKMVAKELLNPRNKKTARARFAALFNEITAVTETINATIAGEAAKMVAEAGAYSYKKMNDITGWDGRVANFSSVAMSPQQITQLVTAQTMNGKTLAEWIGSALTPDMDAIEAGIKEGAILGDGYAATVRRISKDMALDAKNLRDLETVVKTYNQTMVGKAQQDIYAANKDIVEHVEWSAILEGGNVESGRGTCPRCIALDGQKWDTDDKSRPSCPLHPRCVHPETSVFAPDKIAAFVTAYDGPVVEITLTDDRRFTTSINHMFATKNGLVKAGSLTDRDYIIDTSVRNRSMLVDPNDNRYPSSIKEQVEAFAKTPGVVTVRMPSSSEDLHGDGEFGDGYVDVITFNSLLSGDFDSFCSEFFGDGGFVDRSTRHLSFLAKSELLFELWRQSLSLGCDVGGFGVDPMLFRGAMLHHVPVGLNYSTNRDIVVDKNFSDSNSAYIEAFGNSVFGNHIEVTNNDIARVNSIFAIDASEVQPRSDSVCMDPNRLSNLVNFHSGPEKFTRIENIRRHYFSGHLYDLHCFSGLYYISGVLSSNCRCLLLPVTKTWKEMGLDVEEMEKAYSPWFIKDEFGNKEEKGRTQMTYHEWFASRDAAFQDKAIGPTRAELFRAGKLKLVDLVDKNGELIPIKDLNATN